MKGQVITAAVCSIVALGIVYLIVLVGSNRPVPTAAIPQPYVIQKLDLSVVPGGLALETNSVWSFFAADYDNDGVPDLWIIKRFNTGTNSTEVHILKGPKFDVWLLHSGTPLHETPDDVRPVKPEKE